MSDLTVNKMSVPQMPRPLSRIRSLLIAPGSDERKLTRLFASEADLVVADLEDAVAPAEKEAARALTARMLAEVPSKALRAVRINGVDTGLAEDDLAALAGLPLDAIMVPKATPEAIAALGPDGPPIVAIVETAQGLRASYEIAASPRVAVLTLGAVDLAAELRLEPRPDGQEILFARSKLVLDSAAAGIQGPIDVVYLNVRDPVGLEAEARLVRSLGFRAKSCIHPDQVAIVNGVFGPSPAEVEWARRVVEAFEQGLAEGRGAVALDGEMIDLPVVNRARSVLDDAQE